MGVFCSTTKGNKNIRITKRDRAILDVKVQRDRLKQYQKKLVFVAGRETEIAKDHYARGNKSLALLALKKRAYQEKILTQTNDQLLNLETLIGTIEFSEIEKQVLDGLEKGNHILNELSNQMKIEDVQLLMEETAEAIAYQNEISQLLSDKFVESDEQELLDELESLVKEQKASPESLVKEQKGSLDNSAKEQKVSSPQINQRSIDALPTAPTEKAESTSNLDHKKKQPILTE